MSYSLVKKSLDLVETTFETHVGGEEERVVTSVRHHPHAREKKELRGVSDVRKKHLKTVSQVRKSLVTKRNLLEENVKRLIQCTQAPLDDSTADLILKRFNKAPLEKVKGKESKEESAFTEEDFAKFEKEYFGS